MHLCPYLPISTHFWEQRPQVLQGLVIEHVTLSDWRTIFSGHEHKNPSGLFLQPYEQSDKVSHKFSAKNIITFVNIFNLKKYL